MGRSSTPPPTSDAGLAYLASPPHALLPPLVQKTQPLPSHALSSHTLPSRSLPAHSPPSYSNTQSDTRPELPPIQLVSNSNGAAADPLPPISALSAVTAVSDSTGFSLPPTADPSACNEASFTPSAAAQSPSARAHTRTHQAQSSPVTQHWPSLNPLTAYYTPGHIQSAELPLRMDIDSSSTSPDARSTTTPDRHLEGRAGSVTLDDPDVRLAAEALGDLRADFVSSPPSRPSRLPASSSSASPSNPEPLLSLLTTSHPLLAKTIEGTTSAYNSSKNFSPRFKSGAEYVEGYLTPISNTLGSVGRATGVEGGMRWFLNSRRRRQASSRDAEAADPKSHKRRRMDLRKSRQQGGSSISDSPASMSAWKSDASRQDKEPDTLGSVEERRFSMSTVDSLPAYDDQRSPAYTESADAAVPVGTAGSAAGSSSEANGSAPWQSRLIMSTSGLSIAMSDESLRSLKYCLNWLRWANDHMGNAIGNLKTALDQFEAANAERAQNASNTEGQSGQQQHTAGADAARAQDAERVELAAHIAALRSDVLRTLRGVIDTVSRYGGGALPENARILVHRHLTSLPQRFRLANQADAAHLLSNNPNSDKEVRESAQRVLVLAKEGLDMMSQVSGVLDGTIVSAEEWCEKLGKKKPLQPEQATDRMFSLPAQAAAPSSMPTSDRITTDVVMQE